MKKTQETNPEDDSALIRNLYLGAIGYLVILCLAFLAFQNTKGALGAIWGGLIALFNFRFMEWTCKRLLGLGNPGQARSKMTSLIVFKNVFPLVTIGASVLLLDVDSLGLLTGLSAPVAAIMAYAAWLTVSALFESKEG